MFICELRPGPIHPGSYVRMCISPYNHMFFQVLAVVKFRVSSSSSRPHHDGVSNFNGSWAAYTLRLHRLRAGVGSQILGATISQQAVKFSFDLGCAGSVNVRTITSRAHPQTKTRRRLTSPITHQLHTQSSVHKKFTNYSQKNT